MQVRSPDFRQSLLAVYTLNNLNQQQSLRIQTSNVLYLVANPTGSLTAIIGAKMADWLYDVVGKTVTLDKILKASLLPPKRVVGFLNILQKTLNGISACCPTVIHPIFPVHILCEDVAVLVSQTHFALTVSVKVKACIAKTSDIANETIVAETVRQLSDALEHSIKTTAYNILPTPIDSSPANQSNSWLGAAWGYTSQAINAGANLLVEGSAQYASHQAAEFAKNKTERVIDDCAKGFNSQIESLEHNYLNQVSGAVVDSTAKKTFSLCLSVGVGYLTSNYLLPDVTKWCLSHVVGEAVAETVTTAVKVTSACATAFGLYSYICQYDSDRRRNHENYASKLESIESTVVDSITSTLQASVNALPTLQGRFTLYGQEKFVERCKTELPATFRQRSN